LLVTAGDGVSDLLVTAGDAGDDAFRELATVYSAPDTSTPLRGSFIDAQQPPAPWLN
jgi:hypothetical protein